jgi:hypothetical protein
MGNCAISVKLFCGKVSGRTKVKKSPSVFETGGGEQTREKEDAAYRDSRRMSKTDKKTG